MSVKTMDHDKNEDRVCCSEPQFDIILYIVILKWLFQELSNVLTNDCIPFEQLLTLSEVSSVPAVESSAACK